jgi:GntR family transcriptional regulator, carbon starvation induced regulator
MPSANGSMAGIATIRMNTGGLRMAAAADATADGASLIAKTQDAIRRDIIRHVLAPGKRLKIQSLMERYGVGLSPVREALALICGAGLVIREDRRGFRVAPVSLADYRDAQLVIGRLWPFALRLGIANGDQAWEQRLVLALYRTLNFDWARAEHEPQLYDDWDGRFRGLQRELVAGSGSPTLVALVDTLMDRVERYRWLVPEAKADTALDDRNHRALVDALIARDIDKLDLAMRNYVAGGRALVKAIESKLGA